MRCRANTRTAHPVAASPRDAGPAPARRAPPAGVGAAQSAVRLVRVLCAAGALAAVMVAAPGAARAAGLTLRVDRTEVRVGDHLVLTLTAEGTQSAQPELEPLSDFDVHPQPLSTQVRLVNGRFSASVVATYLLVPKRAGTFSIGAASVVIDGKNHRTRPVSVRVVAADAEPGADRALFITTGVSNPNPYVGEQLVFTLRVYQRVQLAQASLRNLELDGFLEQDLGKQKSYDTTLNGVEYRVTEIRKALFPQQAGKRVIPPAALDCQVVTRSQRRPGSFDDFFESGFDSFFGHTETRPRTVKSAALELDVRPLPPAPPGFSGLVGEFDVRAALSNTSPKVGESSTLTLTVSGRGNAQSIPEPLIDGIEGRFKVYDDKPTSTLEAGLEGVSGSKSFVKALVPLAAGELRLPPIRLVYFDPREGAFRTARTEPLVITALPPTQSEELRLTEIVTPTGGKIAVKVLADDILPIYAKLDALSLRRLSSLARLLYGGGLTLPPLVFVGLWLVRRRRERLASDLSLRRRRAASRRFRAGLAELTRALKEDGPTRAAELGSRALREYVGDELNLEGGALTPEETAAHLTAAGAEARLVAQVRELLESCEALQYGGAPQGAESRVQVLPSILDRMRKELGRSLDRRVDRLQPRAGGAST